MPVVKPSSIRVPLWAGSAVLSGVFTEEQLAHARAGQDAFYRGESNRTPEISWAKPRRSRARSRKHPYVSFFRSEIRNLVRSEVLAARIGELCGASEVRLWHDQLLWEAPRRRSGKREYHWHTERSRWKTCQCPLMVTAWIPLDEVTEEMGPITMVEGSEEQPWIDLPEGWEPEESSRRSVLLNPGEVSLHCWHTVHGNPPNLGDQTRRVVAAHYSIGAVEYRRSGEFSHVNERVVQHLDGVPDFGDEEVCPVVWGK